MSTPPYLQRHHDYQLSIATLPADGIQGIELPLDPDAAFALQLVKQRPTPGSSIAQVSYKFKLPGGYRYQSSDFRNDAFGVGAQHRGNVIYPAQVYPADGSIQFDIQNNSGGTLTNVKILCRGRKLYAPGTIDVPQWPRKGEGKVSTLPYVYPFTLAGIAQNNGNANVANQILVRADGDFALRCAFADSASLVNGYNAPYDQLYVKLYDRWNHAYSNEPIHIDDLFGPSSGPSGATGGGPVVQWSPNLFTPEIYIRANDPLYFDVFRTDTAGGTVTLQMGFSGVKIYRL